MASSTKALVAILALCAGSGLIGYNLAPQPVSLAKPMVPDKPMVPKPVRTSDIRNGEQHPSYRCFGTLKKEASPVFSFLYLYRDGGVACVVGSADAEHLVLDACKVGEFCVVTASPAASCGTGGSLKSTAGFVPLDDCTVLERVFAARPEVVTVRPITKNSPPSSPTEASTTAKAPSDNRSNVVEGSKPKPSRVVDKQAEQTNEIELRSLGNRKVNEGITRERYVLHSLVQLTNVSNRTIRIEEWWINRRRNNPLCSKTAEMESSALREAEKLKQETGRDISGLFERQLRPLRPGEFMTLDINNDHCGSIFRVDVRTDHRTEFWTVD